MTWNLEAAWSGGSGGSIGFATALETGKMAFQFFFQFDKGGGPGQVLGPYIGKNTSIFYSI
jgi:hypothetical protein